MTLLRSWLLGVTAAALAVSLAQALTPEGTVKKVCRLTGGMVLLLALAKPLLSADLTALAGEWGSGHPGTEETGQGGEEVLKTLIAQKAGAYIVDKGQALGCPCAAAVTVETDSTGWPVPWSAEITGRWTGEQRRELERAVEADLGIPPSRQRFREEGS